MRNLNAPMFCDVKLVVIMRGISGSGKSTLANQIENEFYNIINKMDIEELYNEHVFKICSADNYFTDEDGNYNFDASQLPDAHDYCFEEFMDALNNGANLIVLDNTNLVKKWYQKYIDEAVFYGYKVVQVNTHTHTISEEVATEYFERCVHSVPFHTIKRQVSFYEPDSSLERFCLIDISSYFKEGFGNVKLYNKSFTRAKKFEDFGIVAI